MPAARETILQSPPVSSNHITVSLELATDLDTPVSLYLKLASTTNGPSFLLESVTGGVQVARYSFIGVQPKVALVIRGQTVERHGDGRVTTQQLPAGRDPLDVVRVELEKYSVSPGQGLPRFIGGMVGYLGYENVQFFEPALSLPRTDLPDGIFLLADTLLAFDHARGRAMLMTTVPDGEQARAAARLESLSRRLALSPAPQPVSTEGSNLPAEIETTTTLEEFGTMVRRAKEYITAGDIFQVVLSQRLSRTTAAKPFDIYRALRRLNPSPYMFFFNFKDLAGEPFHLLGASPEILTRLEGQLATVRPIAGTRPRGKTALEDSVYEADLLADPKERAEHVMLVDLGRNDIGRVCQYGTVKVGELMTVERYSHVMHIVSNVSGTLRPDSNAYDLLRATFPAGTVSGAPKVRAMQIIAELEGRGRGPYAGLVGYVGFDGSMDTCITLRTMWMQPSPQPGLQRVTLQAGAGIVADSDPAREYEETLNKARALLKAIELAEPAVRLDAPDVPAV
jgi:anthranilate synthase component 1